MNSRRLRYFVALCIALSSLHAAAFGFDDVAREAAALAAQPYRAAAADPRLAALSYDEYRAVRFRPERALWADSASPFQLQFFPLGRGNVRPLRLYEVVDGEPRAVAVPASQFRNDGPAEGLPVDGAAGWRAHVPLNDPARRDEVIVFLGASYFRAVGAGLHYGLSARGLAIDTVGGSGEEFPAFTAFWFQRPDAGARELRFLALLDSPSATGAYEFAVRPGTTTTIDVRARIHLRREVAMLGIAPLTSMFLSGETQPAADDFRPEVHDSDGLQMALADGEWLWRPLVNPRGVFVSSFSAASPRGFGLLQRDRAFTSYEDLEARYDLRPSAWVEPLGDWGRGAVQLLQFHTPDETHDNIGAWWRPEPLPRPGQPLELAWRVHFGGAGLAPPPGAWVAQSRRGHGYREAGLPGSQPRPRQWQYHIDFVGPALAGLPPDAVRAVASGDGNVRGLRAIAQPNPVTGGWRVTLDFERIDPARAVELRAYLRAGDKTLSETWALALPPE